MTPITLNSLNMPVEPSTTGIGTRRGIPSPDRALAATGRFGGMRVSSTATRAPQSPEAHGLGRIERKSVGKRGMGATVSEAANRMASVWIGIPFAAVFVLGCLTLG